MSAQTPAESLRACRASIALHSKSFSLASRLLARDTRDRAAVVYAWCRRADDAIDSAGPEQQRDAVQRLRSELERVYTAKPPSDPVLGAFRDVVRSCSIPQTYPEELIAGMQMDAAGTRYPSWAELHRYCYRVAGTVGLMMSHVMGVRDESALRNAAHLGMAMQLTNVCRDVLEDWQMGRLYLPGELLAAHGAGALERELGRPFPEWARAPVAAAVRAVLAEAERFYASGERGLPALPWQCAVAVRAARLVYAAIGEQVERARCDVCAGRAVVPTWRKLSLAAAAAGIGIAELPGRAADRLRGSARPRVPHTCLEFPDGVLPV
jgi:phytoene synthase